jgi:hypothetical protein
VLQIETVLDTKSPYYTPVRMVGGNGKIPLSGGYFEVPLPERLFTRNPQEIKLKWIDFYRSRTAFGFSGRLANTS